MNETEREFVLQQKELIELIQEQKQLLQAHARWIQAIVETSSDRQLIAERYKALLGEQANDAQ